MLHIMAMEQVVFGRYEVQELWPRGGQAYLAKGIDQNTGNPVVIKQLATDPSQAHYAQELARFKRSGTLRIHHRAVVDPCDFGEENGEWYQIMPWIEGETLELYVQQAGGRLAIDSSLNILREILEGTAAFHMRHVVHRDIKPTNIIIDPSAQPHIIDFGICRIITQNTITSRRGLLGTLSWMAPEQIADSTTADFRTDIYAIGAILYFMLTGSPVVPDQSDPVRVVRSICEDMPPLPSTLNPSVPSYLDAACQRALAKRAEDRFQTANEFQMALQGMSASNMSPSVCSVCLRPLLSAADLFCTHCGSATSVTTQIIPRCLACGTQVGEQPSCPGCRKSFSQPDHRLVFTYGPAAGTIFRIPQGTFEVGRHQICPRDQYISSRHFRVICQNGCVAITDVGSRNKTYVAGESADEPLSLQSGEELRIAHNVATYAPLFIKGNRL